MNVAHFYHVYSGEGDLWRDPVAEHMGALEDAKFDGYFGVGIVGSPESWDHVRYQLNHLRRPDEESCVERGWEQHTVSMLRAYAQENDGAVMYAHTKGAANARVFQDQWRQSMTQHVIKGWRNCRDALASGHFDAVGCHWLTAEEFPHVKVETDYPMFGGNFWMATCEYIRTLPPVPMERRHEAESWIGLGNPRVLDLLPGWPGAVPFPRIKMRRLIAGY